MTGTMGQLAEVGVTTGGLLVMGTGKEATSEMPSAHFGFGGHCVFAVSCRSVCHHCTFMLVCNRLCNFAKHVATTCAIPLYNPTICATLDAVQCPHRYRTFARYLCNLIELVALRGNI